MFFYAAIIASIAGLAITTYTDLKERIAPNKITFGMLFLGIIIYGTQSIMEMRPEPIIYSLLGAALGFMFAWALWKIGVFAGGDVKLFMGLGALNPFTPALIKAGTVASLGIPIFPLTLFMYSLLAFLPYGLALSLYKLHKNKPFQKKVIEDVKKRTMQGLHGALFLAGVGTILVAFGQTPLFSLPIAIVWGFSGKLAKIFTILAAIVASYLSIFLFAQAFLAISTVVVLLYGTAKLMFSLRPLLSKEIKLSELEEGMIPAKTLAWEGKKVIEIAPLNLHTIIKYAKEQKVMEMFTPKREIVSALKARGLTEEEIKELKKLAKKKLILSKIMIKDSMPFVPTMLLGYLFCLALGDLFWTIILGGLI